MPHVTPITIIFAFGAIALIKGVLNIYKDEGRGFLSGCLILAAGLLSCIYLAA